MKKKIILIGCITFIVIIMIILSIYHFYIKPHSWGEEGQLQLILTSDRSDMNINESINITYTIKNIGNSNLRILYPIGPQIQIFNSTNSSVNWIGPIMDPPSSPTNSNLHVLKKGETKSFNYIISSGHWDLKSNETYRIKASYYSGVQDQISLPYWKGKVYSNELFFNVN